MRPAFVRAKPRICDRDDARDSGQHSGGYSTKPSQCSGHSRSELGWITGTPDRQNSKSRQACPLVSQRSARREPDFWCVEVGSRPLNVRWRSRLKTVSEGARTVPATDLRWSPAFRRNPASGRNRLEAFHECLLNFRPPPAQPPDSGLASSNSTRFPSNSQFPPACPPIGFVLRTHVSPVRA